MASILASLTTGRGGPSRPSQRLPVLPPASLPWTVSSCCPGVPPNMGGAAMKEMSGAPEKVLQALLTAHILAAGSHQSLFTGTIFSIKESCCAL